MLKYILRRLAIFIPSMMAIVTIAFIMTENAPGDPVSSYLGLSTEMFNSTEKGLSREEIEKVREKLGENRPVFYLSLTSACYPDTLHKIQSLNEREALTRMAYEFGDWPEVQQWKVQTDRFQTLLSAITPSKQDYNRHVNMRAWSFRLKSIYETDLLAQYLHQIDTSLTPTGPEYAALKKEVAAAKTTLSVLQNEGTVWRRYVPTLHWYGTYNQFHKFFTGLFVGDLGFSYANKQPIGAKIMDYLPYSLLLNLIAIILGYMVAIPLGVYSARRRNTLKDKILTTLVFALYSLPAFWIATLLMNFLANDEYLHLFPAGGLFSLDWDTFSTWGKFTDFLHHLILPIICYTYASFAFLSRQMRVGMLENLHADYIRTARAKGLTEKLVIWRHAFRNSVLPILSIFGSIFPAMVGGSIILESIFSIPGMGRLSIESIFMDDYPVIIAIFTLTGLMTMVGILISDILMVIVDPRISFKNSRS